MLLRRMVHLASLLFCFTCMGMATSSAQCTATIVAGNGSFNDNQIGWSSPGNSATVELTPPLAGPSSDGGAFLRPFTSGGADVFVNIAMDELTNGGIYIVDWEAIHGVASTFNTYTVGVTYTVNILDGASLIRSEDFSLSDPNNWVSQTLSFTSTGSNLIFQIQLKANNFGSGTYKMGIDGMSITCNGTTRPCDLDPPTFRKTN